MRPRLFRLSLSHLTEFPGRTLLGILGIALGTAVYLGISLAAASALKSFQNGVTAVAGRAQWRLSSPGAQLPESLFLTVRRLPGVKAAAPVVESVLTLAEPHQGPVLLLGSTHSWRRRCAAIASPPAREAYSLSAGIFL